VSAELHLPDLPEVPVHLGPEPGAPRPPRVGLGERLRQALQNYLPLLVMVALALASWWLLRTAPKGPEAARPARAGNGPDYQLERFQIRRYDAQGRLAARIEGEKLRHYPDTDEHRIESVRLWLHGADGRLTEATARQGVVNGAQTDVRLMGDVQVVSQDAQGGEPLQLNGQQLHVQVPERQLSTDQPVRVQQGRSAFQAQAMTLDEPSRRLELRGHVRAEMQPQPRGSR
jgi:lipopolysaccharide export system protein LptC